MISVLVPLMEERRDFFERAVFPQLCRNNPLEILVDCSPRLKAIKINELKRKAQGDYIFMCDDDVVLHENCLKTLSEWINDKDVCFTGFIEVDHPVTGHRVFVPPSDCLNTIHLNNCVSTQSLVKKSSMEDMDPAMKYDDWDLWLTMSEHGKTFIRCPGVWMTVFYQRNQEGITKTITQDTAKWRQQMFDKHGMKDVCPMYSTQSLLK